MLKISQNFQKFISLLLFIYYFSLPPERADRFSAIWQRFGNVVATFDASET